MKTKKIFIEWAEYGSRAASLAHAFGAKTFFIGKVNKHKNVLISFSTYPAKIIKNYKIIKENRPAIVYITNTTWIIAFVNLLFSKIFKHKLILDSHSCAFDHELIKYPLFLSKYFATKANLSIVTNLSHYNLLKNHGAETLIISDIPFEDKLAITEKIKMSEKFNICYVCTFATDEPYIEVFEAAKMNNNIKIYVTGNYNKVNINPENYSHITFTGFCSNEKYKLYINSADALMTLTTRENTMQRAGSEAISVGKPLITSDTKMLRNYFTEGTIFVKNTRKEINKGFDKMILKFEELKKGINILKEKRKKSFSETLEVLNKKLEE